MSVGTQAHGGREQTPGVLGHRMAFVDVLRAVAILTVIVHHLTPDLGATFGKLHDWGGRGVDLFFVLSGFLIGSTCLERAASSGHAGFVNQAKAYWLLRSARIFPLYFLLLGVFALGLPGFNPDAAFVLRHWPQYFFTFTSNYFGQGTLELGIFWSLAIEEQFYLAVGLLILLCSRNRQTLAAAFIGLALAAIAVSLVYRWELFSLRADELLPEQGYIFKLFHSTLARMDQLALGLLSAVLAKRFNGLKVAGDGRWVRVSTWGVIAVSLGALVYFPHRPVVGFLLIGILFAASVLWLQRPAVRTLVMSRWESALMAPLVYVGKLSFGLYLFHPITRTWVEQLLPTSLLPAGSSLRAVVFLTVWTVGTTALAAVSYRFFEEPLLSAARRKSKQFLQAPAQAEPVVAEVEPRRLEGGATGAL
jgi:peptidoglycan/LPS O-acetylase OafA/YrhL